MDKIKIIIADDHPLIRIGLANIINANKAYSLLGEAKNGKEALDLIYFYKPDIVILDIEMPIVNGLDVCIEIKKNKLPTKVLFLTMLKEEELYDQAIKHGASGYLLKDHAVEELNTAIETIANGKIYISEAITSFLTNTKSHIINDAKIAEQINRLTKTEKDVLLLIAQNLSTKDIASNLFITESTIKSHRHNIIRKLGLGLDQNSLLKFALENSAYLK